MLRGVFIKKFPSFGQPLISKWKSVSWIVALAHYVKSLLYLQGLKNHAVTMFEVGKLADESMDSFIVELGKVGGWAGKWAGRWVGQVGQCLSETCL